MKAWEEYPDHYRQAEVGEISRAICTGECAAMIGLSGSGKSNLMLFLTPLPVLMPNPSLFSMVSLLKNLSESIFLLHHGAGVQSGHSASSCITR